MAKGDSKIGGGSKAAATSTAVTATAQSPENEVDAFIREMAEALTKPYGNEERERGEIPLSTGDLQAAVEAFAMTHPEVDEMDLLMAIETEAGLIERGKQKEAFENQPKTGVPVVFSYVRNPQSSPQVKGMDFGQKIEPKGRYMNVDNNFDLTQYTAQGWESGYIRFDNPLVIEYKNTNSSGWKKDLSQMFGGKTGRALSAAIQKAGYDGIVTITTQGKKRGIEETVDLAGKRTTREEFKRKNKL